MILWLRKFFFFLVFLEIQIEIFMDKRKSCDINFKIIQREWEYGETRLALS